MNSKRSILIVLIALVAYASAPARAYVDLAPTLTRLVNESEHISLIEVDKFSREKGAILYKEVRVFKGTAYTQPIKHAVGREPGQTVSREILEAAEPGRRAILMVSTRGQSLICLGMSWYQTAAGNDGWQKIDQERPDLPLAFYGNVSRLAEAIPLLLAGKDAIITTVPHGADSEAASFDLALNRANLPGMIKVQRIRANMRMPQTVLAVSANPAYLIGPGPIAVEDIPAAIKRLGDADVTVRAEAADDLRWLGAAAAPAAEALTKALDDSAPSVRMAAAAALLHISHDAPRPLEVIAKGLSSTDVPARRAAARAAALSNSAAAPLAKQLAGALSDSDELVRLAALQAICSLGPSAAEAQESVGKLLESADAAVASDAADALGRIGTPARPQLGKLAKLLSATSVSLRWAAVRAMSQIGGPDAHPAVEFMIKEMQKSPSEVDGYNMMVYIGLLGPVAKDAVPTIRNTRIKNPALPGMAIWATDPGNRFPWDSNGGGGPGGGMMRDADFVHYIFISYLRELGDRVKPAAAPLAHKVMDGSAGEIPQWGYQLLARFPDEVLPILTPALAHENIVQRERATVALGFMGPAAAGAMAQLEAAARKAPTERERRLIEWAIRESRIAK